MARFYHQYVQNGDDANVALGVTGWCVFDREHLSVRGAALPIAVCFMKRQAVEIRDGLNHRVSSPLKKEADRQAAYDARIAPKYT